MHEQDKLQEAQYFLTRMEAELPEPDAFRYNMSAFLSAARSVAQYARREAKGKPGGQAWYDSVASSEPLIKFFASERDTNIHERPVEPGGHVNVYATDFLQVSETATVETFDVDGNLVDVVAPRNAEPHKPPAPHFSFEFVYRFVGWSGPEDALTLCRAYLQVLDRLIAEGQRFKFLS